MPLDPNRTPLRPLRGSKAALEAVVAEMQEGELCIDDTVNSPLLYQAVDDGGMVLRPCAVENLGTALVQDTTPIGTDWELGKTWLQNDADLTYSVWNGTAWIGISSGGTFTLQPTVIYVDSVNGNDANDGHRIINPKRTIKNAVLSANDGDVISVVPGVYQEILPIDITVNNLSIKGDAQRSCFIHPTPATELATMFRCNSGTYIDGFTFCGLKAVGARGGNAIDSDLTYGLPAQQGWVAGFYPGCVIRKSPFFNNCTVFCDDGINNATFDPNNYSGTGGDLTSAPTGGGILVDGSLPSVSSPLRSFVINEFTQVNLDGPGLLVANNGYAQAVSFFSTFCHYHVKALSGGQVNLEVGTTDFGRYGLIADGKSSAPIFTATANGAASGSAITFAINAPTPAVDWFGSTTRPGVNMMAEIGANLYPILSSSPNGLGWNVTISRPNPSNRAENLGLVTGHSNGAVVNFYLRSMISTSAHTMEYAGSGCDYRALPYNGGAPIEENESISRNGGKVWLTSTDQSGKFKVGDAFVVDQQTGFVSIEGLTIATDLVSDPTPQLGGNLDVLDKQITTSLANNDVIINGEGDGSVRLGRTRLTGAARSGFLDLGVATAMDCRVTNYFKRSVSGNVTFTITNVPASVLFSLTLELAYTSGVVTLPASVRFAFNVLPTFFAGRTYQLVLDTTNGGTTWWAVALEFTP